MAKKCPLTGDLVLYLECRECEDKAICKRGDSNQLKKEVEEIEKAKKKEDPA